MVLHKTIAIVIKPRRKAINKRTKEEDCCCG
jgi:hypothetical protein